jgi:hypothetical protein
VCVCVCMCCSEPLLDCFCFGVSHRTHRTHADVAAAGRGDVHHVVDCASWQERPGHAGHRRRLERPHHGQPVDSSLPSSLPLRFSNRIETKAKVRCLLPCCADPPQFCLRVLSDPASPLASVFLSDCQRAFQAMLAALQHMHEANKSQAKKDVVAVQADDLITFRSLKCVAPCVVNIGSICI